jgi:hypothetical protein
MHDVTLRNVTLTRHQAPFMIPRPASLPPDRHPNPFLFACDQVSLNRPSPAVPSIVVTQPVIDKPYPEAPENEKPSRQAPSQPITQIRDLPATGVMQ